MTRRINPDVWRLGWRRRSVTIPPDSPRAWVSLVVWELWMGGAVGAALLSGVRLIITAPGNIVMTRAGFSTGQLGAVMNAWCGALLMVVAVGLLWELWSAAAPKPITDDFLRLLDDSFGRSLWRPRTWPWTRLRWAYGFATIGAAIALILGVMATEVLASPQRAHPPTFRVETSERFAPIQK